MGVGAFIISYLIRALLWKTLLRKCNDITTYPLFKSVIIGQMGNNILPFRGGELLRIYSIQQTTPVKVPLAFSSIVVERVLDLISLIVMIGVLSLAIDLPDLLKTTISGIVVCTLLSLMIMTYFIHKNSYVNYSWFINIFPENRRDAIASILNNLIQGLSSLLKPSWIVRLVFLSLSCWIFVYFAIVFALKAYHLEIEWIIPLFVLVVLNIGMMSPLLPASLGNYQFFSIVALGHFGIEKSVALGFSFVIQTIDLIASVGLGLFFFYTSHITVSQLFNKAVVK